MSVKYRIDFTDKQGINEWSLRIVDTNYESYSDRVIADGGTVQSIGCLPLEITELVEYQRFQLNGEGFNLSYGERGDDPHKSIKGSTLKFTFHAENASDLTFIEDIAQTQEQTYFVDLYKGGSLFWRGGILQDLIRIPYSYFPIRVQLQATCGLARLKGIAKEMDEYDNILSSIAVILRELDNGNLWADTDNFIRTSVRWFEDQMVIADGLDSLAYSRLFRQSTEYNLNTEGEKEYRDWYKWLTCILDTFGARIFMAEGLWQIVQIDEIANNPSRYNLYSRNYVYSGTGNPAGATGILSSGTAWTTFFEVNTSGVSNRFKRENSSYGFLPADKEIKVMFDAPFERNSLINTIRISTTAQTNFGAIENLVGAANQLSLIFRNQFYKVTNSSGIAKNYFIRQTVKVMVDGVTNYYLQPSGTSYDWTTTDSSFILDTYGVFSIAGGASFLINGEEFLSTDIVIGSDIPIDGDLKITITMEVLDSSYGISSDVSLVSITSGDGAFAFNQRGTLVYAYYYTTDSLSPIDGVEYVVTNPTLTEATNIKEYDSVFIGDELSQTDYQRIKVFDGSTWENSSAWGYRGTGTSKSIIKLRLSQAMNYFERPKRLFDLTYIGNPNPLRSILLGSKYYLWNWIEITARGKAASAVINTESYELKTNGSGFTVSDTLDFQREAFNVSSQAGKRGNPTDGVVDYDAGFLSENLIGAKTSITIGELNNDLAFTGETVRIYQPANGYFEDVVLTQDALQGATTLSIQSKTFSTPMLQGALLQRAVAKSSVKSRALEIYSISSIPNAKMIHDANSGYAIDGSGYIDTWRDSSGENHNSSGTDLEPNNNGLFNAYFNGSSSKLVNTTLDPSQPFSLALLINLAETNVGRFIICNDNNNFYIETAAGDGVTIGTSVKTASAEIRRDEWVVFQLEMNGASSRARSNNDSWTALNLDSDHIKHPIFGSNGSTDFCEMSISAICIFGGILTADQWQSVYLNLKSRL